MLLIVGVVVLISHKAVHLIGAAFFGGLLAAYTASFIGECVKRSSNIDAIDKVQ